jgi:hypothetical protein
MRISPLPHPLDLFLSFPTVLAWPFSSNAIIFDLISEFKGTLPVSFSKTACPYRAIGVPHFGHLIS